MKSAQITDDSVVDGNAAGRIFGAVAAAERFGVSVRTLRRKWPEGHFPAPIRITDSRIGWAELDIIKWQRERFAERDALMRNSA